MHFFSLFAVASSALLPLLVVATPTNNTTGNVTGDRGDAAVIRNNPVGKVYMAVLPEKAFNRLGNPLGNIKGSISATANPDGVGVTFTVNFQDFPTVGGPFTYHLHDAPVPADGNCTKTLAHLDPYIRGQAIPCNPAAPATCEVGDLTGKHGKVTSNPYFKTYSDDYASTLEGIGAFFGNRSIVIHAANSTRLTCANFFLSNTSITNITNNNSTGYNGGVPNTVTGTANNHVAAISFLSLTTVLGLCFLL